MSYVKNIVSYLVLVMMLAGLIACDIQDDLLPSSSDERGAVIPGSIGHLPTQVAADFTVKDVYGNDFVLYDHLTIGSNSTPADVVVLYFTMWCPACLADTDTLYTNIIPQFSSRGTVVYALVDYVSDSVNYAYSTAQSNGYLGSSYEILADTNNLLENQFNGAMGITVVIDSDGTILMNEDYKSDKLIEILDQQLPLP